MKPVFGYLRVSGTGQLGGSGFDRQRETIEDYCQRNGCFVLRWFSDGAVSGEIDVGDRQGFLEMLSLAGEGTTKTIVVERADRLARTLAVSELACAECRSNGFTIIEAATDTDLTNSDDPTRVLIRQVMGAVSEWNKNVMVKRLRAARDKIRSEKGKCEGRTKFSEASDEDSIVTFALIRSMRPAHTFRFIAGELNRRERKAPQGGAWNASSVHYLVRSAEQPVRLMKKNSALLVDLPV